MGWTNFVKRKIKKAANRAVKSTLGRAERLARAAARRGAREARKRGKGLLKKALVAGSATGAGIFGGPAAAALAAKISQEVVS